MRSLKKLITEIDLFQVKYDQYFVGKVKKLQIVRPQLYEEKPEEIEVVEPDDTIYISDYHLNKLQLMVMKNLVGRKKYENWLYDKYKINDLTHKISIHDGAIELIKK